MKKILALPVIIAFLCACSGNFAQKNNQASQDSLKFQLDSLIKTYKADVAVSIIGMEDGDSISVRGNEKFVMMSVVKFPLALYILKLVEEGKLSLQQTVPLNKKNLRENTWSPMRDRYGAKETSLTLDSILWYAAGLSDNNACDILFDVSGGVKNAEDYIRRRGFSAFSIGSNYAHMNQDSLQVNSTSANVMSGLFRQFYQGKMLNKKHTDLLMDYLVKTPTAPNRIKGLLPPNTVVAHKTGTFGNIDTFTRAINDAGIVTLPNGKHFVITVLVNNSKYGVDESAAIIAKISKLAWDYFIRKETAAKK